MQLFSTFLGERERQTETHPWIEEYQTAYIIRFKLKTNQIQQFSLVSYLCGFIQQGQFCPWVPTYIKCLGTSTIQDSTNLNLEAIINISELKVFHSINTAPLVTELTTGSYKTAASSVRSATTATVTESCVVERNALVAACLQPLYNVGQTSSDKYHRLSYCTSDNIISGLSFDLVLNLSFRKQPISFVFNRTLLETNKNKSQMVVFFI